MPIDRDFYNRESTIVAKELLGKYLIHESDEGILCGKIVETEAYMGIMDKGAHVYGGKRTPRVEIMYGEPGHSYVYLIYGMYHCFNIISNKKDIPQGVLIRALEPVKGIEIMAQNRYKKEYIKLNKKEILNLTSGPGKLCKAFNINKDYNGEDICGNKLYVEEGNKEKVEIIETTRIGIDYAEEDKYKPWRYYIKDNDYVSVKV